MQIYAILKDHAKSNEQDFPPINIKEKWDTLIGTLEMAERMNKQKYHKLMHELYLNALCSLPPSTNVSSHSQAMKKINWSIFTADGSDSEDYKAK
ncbi:hypothetical protein VKT23_016637 [Stygiomarasmius scandens]|uniref:Uncharacterized protein n=1 Tax=Marasmiellus scandens TaxID=2682957 RepID=A0ABR1IXV3_9AGAR